jgi:hypothetical protein|nr:MAG TPA: hypothetical protein [Caudoviricetes sp.]
MRITLKKIIEFELLRKHSFNSFDAENLDDVIALSYCLKSRREKAQLSFEKVLKLTKENPDLIGETFEDIGKELLYLSQFRETLSEVEKAEGKGKEQKEIFVKDIVGRLALSGIGLSYLMNDCELYEVGFLVEALDKKTREQMELQRFWNFIQLSPHLDKKTTMRDLIEFPWEANKPKEDASITEEEKRMASEILNYKKD